MRFDKNEANFVKFRDLFTPIFDFRVFFSFRCWYSCLLLELKRSAILNLSLFSTEFFFILAFLS